MGNDELIRKEDAIKEICEDIQWLESQGCTEIPLAERKERDVDIIKNLPPVQPDEKLEKCRFEYIHACRIVTYPTPDTTKKDISDAYAVIKALQPIFGDVTF